MMPKWPKPRTPVKFLQTFLHRHTLTSYRQSAAPYCTLKPLRLIKFTIPLLIILMSSSVILKRDYSLYITQTPLIRKLIKALMPLLLSKQELLTPRQKLSLFLNNQPL
jgi:hypothetical protein